MIGKHVKLKLQRKWTIILLVAIKILGNPSPPTHHQTVQHQTPPKTHPHQLSPETNRQQNSWNIPSGMWIVFKHKIREFESTAIFKISNYNVKRGYKINHPSVQTHTKVSSAYSANLIPAGFTRLFSTSILKGVIISKTILCLQMEFSW